MSTVKGPFLRLIFTDIIPMKFLSTQTPERIPKMIISRIPLGGSTVKELKLSYYIGETLLFTIYIPIMVT